MLRWSHFSSVGSGSQKDCQNESLPVFFVGRTSMFVIGFRFPKQPGLKTQQIVAIRCFWTFQNTKTGGFLVEARSDLLGWLRIRWRGGFHISYAFSHQRTRLFLWNRTKKYSSDTVCFVVNNLMLLLIHGLHETNIQNRNCWSELFCLLRNCSGWFQKISANSSLSPLCFVFAFSTWTFIQIKSL